MRIRPKAVTSTKNTKTFSERESKKDMPPLCSDWTFSLRKRRGGSTESNFLSNLFIYGYTTRK